MTRFLHRHPFLAAFAVAIATKLAMTVSVVLVMSMLGRTDTLARTLAAITLLGVIALKVFGATAQLAQ